MTHIEQRGETARLNTILDELERTPLPRIETITARCVPMSAELLAVIERSKEMEKNDEQ